MESEVNILDLFQEISKFCNYRQLIAIKDFWHNFEQLDAHSQTEIRNSLMKFFKCPTCSRPQIRFEDGGRICNKCEYASYGHEQDRIRNSNRLECLKCFKFYKSDIFVACGHNHLCGFCVIKEKLKGRDKCRICNSNYLQINEQFGCDSCLNVFHIKDLFEIRCGCRLCVNCFKIAKNQGSCVKCVGVSITPAEVYEFLHRAEEICFFCENNYKIVEELEGSGEFMRMNCCFLDICVACFKRFSPENVKCAGCAKKINQ